MKPSHRLLLVGLLLALPVACTGFYTTVDRLAPVDGLVVLRTVRDDETIRRLMRQQAETGDPRAMVDYAALLRNTSTFDPDEISRFRSESERFDRMAAERGDPIGQINMGIRCLDRFYEMRRFSCRDDVEAVRWFRLAMEQGNADALAFYGYMTELGRGGLDRDRDRAIAYYTEAGKRGSEYGDRFLRDMTEYAHRRPRGPNP